MRSDLVVDVLTLVLPCLNDKLLGTFGLGRAEYSTFASEGRELRSRALGWRRRAKKTVRSVEGTRSRGNPEKALTGGRKSKCSGHKVTRVGPGTLDFGGRPWDPKTNTTNSKPRYRPRDPQSPADRRVLKSDAPREMHVRSRGSLSAARIDLKGARLIQNIKHKVTRGPSAKPADLR